MTEKSWITSVSKDGISNAARLHPEIAEFAVQIVKRDLKFIKKSGIEMFKRRLYEDLYEIDMFLQEAETRGKVLDSPIVGVAVINLGHESNARIPLTAELWEKERDMPTARPGHNRGFKS
jgi:hypothetical protein